MAASSALNVIALISGGKDSFFSLLHCLAHGHRVVALANLHPAPDHGDADTDTDPAEVEDEEEDLNSFMYQTVGHRVIPLYAAATGLPVYRQPIVGRAVQHGRDYAPPGGENGSGGSGDGEGDGSGATTTDDPDETESMTVLLRRVMAAHPDANAVCAGALLSNYQRTRVESVAARLGLVALAYLWQYPRLPFSSWSSAAALLEGQSSAAVATATYLDDLAAAGFDARIVKVASGGLDETLLWTNVASPGGRQRLQHALARLGLVGPPGGGEIGGGGGGASLLGEGGEYETLVVDGPAVLFRGGSLAVAEADRLVVQEGGGSAWLQIRNATVVAKAPTASTHRGAAAAASAPHALHAPHVRQPDLLDPRFADVFLATKDSNDDDRIEGLDKTAMPAPALALAPQLGHPTQLATWCVVPEPSSSSSSSTSMSVADATRSIVDQIRSRLARHSLTSPTRSIVRTLVVLRRMRDFPAVNAVYATLFSDAPNPPARVTIAAASSDDGDGADGGRDVAVFLSVLTEPAAAGRQGLHVQSRSYWAPANIGPYSQAISMPANRLTGSDTDTKPGSHLDDGGPRIVFVAGQIPLVPASMELPNRAVETTAEAQVAARARATSDTVRTAISASSSATTPASFAFNATLALQHLWRIGAEMNVQWWTSAVAYVPRQQRGNRGEGRDALLSLPDKAVLVAQAWRAAHSWRPTTEGEDDDEHSDGPDLWDRKYDSRYALFSTADEADGAGIPPLPDWSVLAAEGGPHSASTATRSHAHNIPPVFLAEVEELPRAAPVEWHAQAGFGHVAPGSLRAGWVNGGKSEDDGAKVYQTVVQAASPRDDDAHEDKPGSSSSSGNENGRILAQTVYAWPCPVEHQSQSLGQVLLARWRGSEHGAKPDVIYADRGVVGVGAGTLPLVPCASLWGPSGERLAAVAVYTEQRGGA
ncbi:ATP-binding l-psp endoribonuclease family protein [Niveomyces insectorum RCEF 264]|uniref:Diphthine--ammonia ligase n=1 Tax=Niveomyces insectorum RCEF 264 TaxID=1081102 RepID=A0A162MQS0_9HYPO|nr:ATP-binding l-psp endoribonuclease family protein [Niveomyces insectorum RCEF 264]